MSVLDGSSAAVFVLSAPGHYAGLPPRYWCGGNVWSERITEAALFQAEGLVDEQAGALNLRNYTIRSVAIAKATGGE